MNRERFEKQLSFILEADKEYTTADSSYWVQ